MYFGVWVPMTEEQALEAGDDTSWGSLSSARGSSTKTRLPSPYPVSREASMENETDVPLHRLRCLRGLHQSGTIRLGKIADEPRYRWSVENYLKQGNSTHPGRKQVPCLLQRSKTLQEIQNKPFHRYYTQPNLNSRENSNLDENTSRKQLYKGYYSKRFSIVGDVHTGPLTRLPVNCEQTLWRRPTSYRPSSVYEDDDIFKTFTKRIELKPKNFTTSTEQDIFYNKNYPLLLDVHPEEDKAKTPVSKRTPSPELEWSQEMKRGLHITTRLKNLETAVDELEKETDDIDFRTELRNEVFNPSKWLWNVGRASYYKPSNITAAMGKTIASSPSPTSMAPLPRRCTASPSPV